jgi:hypothetical protein
MAFSAPYASLKIDKERKIKLEKELRELGAERITAGIHKEQGAEMVGPNARLIDIAVQNEYGNEWQMPHTVHFEKNGEWYHIKKGTTIRIPATHFIGKLFQDNFYRDDIIGEVKLALHYIVAPYNGFDNTKKATTKTAIRQIGRRMTELLKGFIDWKMFQPNAEMTIAIKGFDKRLYSEGTLYNAIKWRSKKQKGE